MADNKISMPGAFGGLVRYNEEYDSRFVISPAQVVGFIVLVILFILFLKFFFPIAGL